jgi:hypothetical protein
MSAANIKWVQAVNDYYQLKRVYEEEKQRINRKDEDQDQKKNQDQKKDQSDNKSKNKKYPCVDCGKPKGTKFETLYDKKKDGRILSAVCGDVVNPCSLEIKIFCGCTETYGSLIADLEKEIEALKKKIIDDKNKLLFGFISSESAVDDFDKYKKELAELTERLTSVLELYMQETDNREVKEAIGKAQEDICKEIYNVKNAVKEFDKTANLQFIKDAVDIYHHKISVKLRQLSNLQYAYQDVAFDEETGEYMLIQRKTNLENLEITLQDNEVLSFVFKEKDSAKNKKSKTELKKGSTLFLNEMEIVSNVLENNEKEQKEKEKQKEEEETALFTLDDEGKVIWSSKEYANLWDNLGKLLKQTLAQDPVWMEFAMTSFVQKRREGKDLEFVLPPNLILPPKEMPDGSFDLGNDFFNEIYAGMDKTKEEDVREKLIQEAAQQLNFQERID